MRVRVLMRSGKTGSGRVLDAKKRDRKRIGSGSVPQAHQGARGSL